MIRENYLRLSLILNDSKAQTVKTNLVKLIKSVIYTNSNNPLKINEIVDYIKDMFGLEFSPGELISSLKSKKFEGIERVEFDDPIYNTYKLIPREYNKISKKMSVKIIDDLIGSFIKENSISAFTFDGIKKLIFDFLYKAFCADLSTMEALICGKYRNVLSNESFKDINNEEKEIINLFLNWRNEEKNKFVYNAISCGFEYCMLGMKKDNNSLRGIFNGKVFYLDSNIIFRLMGVNNVERKNIIIAFVNKCTEAGITLKYTNITFGEVYATIDYHVEQVSRFYGKKGPISKKSIQALSGKYANLDFLDEYYNWTMTNKGRNGDYQLFSKHLKMLASKVLEPFKMECYEMYNTGKTKEKFDNLFSELKEFRRLHYKSTYEGSVSVDINNYFFIKDKNKDCLGDRIFNVNNYIISADHIFIDWAKNKIVNIIPIIILPSVWYSIILKYLGRTNDDYNAFCQFLKLNINYDEPDDEKKSEILACVLDLDEPAKMKEEIIYDIESKLKNEYKDIESAEEIVSLTIESTIENKISDASKIVKEENKVAINKLKIKYDEKIENESNKKYDIGVEEGSKQKENEIYTKIVASSNKLLSLKHILCWVLRISFWLILPIVVLAIGYFVENKMFSNYCFVFSPLLSVVMNLFKGEKYNNIKQKTNKQKLLEIIIGKKCKKIGINYVEYKNK